MPKVKCTVSGVRGLTEKLHLGTFTAANGKAQEAKWWADNAFADKLKNGADVEATFESKPSKKNPDENELWVTEVDGVGTKQKGSGGHGGGRSAAPKTPQEMHSPSHGGIVKSCIEQGKTVADCREWLKLFKESVEWYG